jgi:predicted small lipoprotein YifL
MSRPSAWQSFAVILLLGSFAGCGGKATEVDSAVVQPDPNVPASKPATKPETPAKVVSPGG